MGEKQPRNLKKDEVKKVIESFIKLLQTIDVNDKPFVVSVSKNNIVTNSEIDVQELKQAFNIQEDSKMDFVRQLYINYGPRIIKNLYPDEEILNLPIISFEERGHNIQLRY